MTQCNPDTDTTVRGNHEKRIEELTGLTGCSQYGIVRLNLRSAMKTRGKHVWGLLLTVFAAIFVGACNESDTEQLPETPFIYAAMGASDAIGYGAFPPTAGYVGLIGARVTELRPGARVRNFGIIDGRIDDFIDVELPQTIAANPDLVTVWTGSNDIWAGADPATFEAGLRTLLQQLRAHTHAMVFVGDLPDLTKAPLFISEPSFQITSERISDFNFRIAAVAAETGCVLVRLSEMSVNPTLFTSDGFHPNNDGYRLMADYFLAEIEPRL